MMPMPRPPKAVIFDLDGTLIDTDNDIAFAINTILADHGRAPLLVEDVKRYVGDGAPVLMDRCFRHTGDAPDPADIPALVERYVDILIHIPTHEDLLYPTARATLNTLHTMGVPLGVCSNKPTGATMGLLKDLGIFDHFQCIVTGDLLPFRKPDPRALTYVLDQIGIPDPTTAIMVGDSPPDIATARAAGVPSVAVSYGYARMPVEQLGADKIIDRLDALLGLF